MSTNVTINGVTYAQPDQGTPPPWGDAQKDIIVAIVSGMLQKAGGAFTLTSEVDFGASYGLKTLYYKSRTANPASAGQIRLARTDVISFRNELNSADLDLAVNSSNQLTFDGAVLAVGTGDVSGPGGSTDNAIARFDGTTGKVIQNSGVTISDGDVISSIGILLSGVTASRLVVTDGSKNLAASSVTATEAGYLSGVASAIQTQINAIRLKRPGYKINTADASQVIVPASAASPAVVRIGNTLYTNTSNATMDIDTAGRGGLDTGTKAASTPYYLYAIPPTSGTTFDLICSVTAPTGAGPTGFTSTWSYLGAFCTQSAGTDIEPFIAADGIYIADNELEEESHTGDINATAKTYSCMPTTAIFAWARLSYQGTQLNYEARITGIGTAANAALVTTIQVSNYAMHTFGWVPIFTAQTMYLRTAHASNTVTCELMGWHENPMAYN